MVGLGKSDTGYDEDEEVDLKRENVRAAIAAGAKQLREAGVKEVDVDPCSDAEGRFSGTFGCAPYSSLDISRWEPGAINIPKLLLVHGDLA